MNGRKCLRRGVVALLAIIPAVIAVGTETGSASAASSSTIQIGLITSVNDPALSFPQLPQAARAAVDYINAHGGVKGHKMVLDFCDDQNDPSTASQCANTLVNTDHVVAIVGTEGAQQTNYFPYLQAAGVPLFCNTPVVPLETTSNLSFPCSAGAAGFYNMGLVVPKGTTKLGYVGYAGLPPYNAEVAQSLKQAGIHASIDLVTAPETTTNWTPIVSQLKQAGVQGVIMQLAGASDAAVITAGGQIGLKVPFMTTSGAVIPQTIQAATNAHITFDVASQFILNPKQNKTRAAMVAQLKKYAPGIVDTVSDGAVDAWLGPTLIAKAGNSGALKNFTASGIKSWLSKQSDLKTGMGAALNFTKAGPISGQPRIVNVYGIPAVGQNQTLIPTSVVFKSLVPGASPPSGT